MKHNILHRTEKELIRILFRERRPLTIREIAMISDMSWITARKYLNSLIKNNICETIVEEKRPKFRLNPDLICELLRRKQENMVKNED
ncbi:MAG: hypothetical protein ACLFUO_05650 [Candidatus Woesearchaeota archaeon]